MWGREGGALQGASRSTRACSAAAPVSWLLQLRAAARTFSLSGLLKARNVPDKLKRWPVRHSQEEPAVLVLEDLPFALLFARQQTRGRPQRIQTRNCLKASPFAGTTSAAAACC